jgi:hypothetical protein
MMMTMADDDIERLLREIDQSPRPTSGGSRVGFAALAAVGGAVVGGVGGLLLWFLPFIGPVSTAVGAALGAFVTALVTGPPRWFR